MLKKQFKQKFKKFKRRVIVKFILLFFDVRYINKKYFYGLKVNAI